MRAAALGLGILSPGAAKAAAPCPDPIHLGASVGNKDGNRYGPAVQSTQDDIQLKATACLAQIPLLWGNVRLGTYADLSNATAQTTTDAHTREPMVYRFAPMLSAGLHLELNNALSLGPLSIDPWMEVSLLDLALSDHRITRPDGSTSYPTEGRMGATDINSQAIGANIRMRGWPGHLYVAYKEVEWIEAFETGNGRDYGRSERNPPTKTQTILIGAMLPLCGTCLATFTDSASNNTPINFAPHRWQLTAAGAIGHMESVPKDDTTWSLGARADVWTTKLLGGDLTLGLRATYYNNPTRTYSLTSGDTIELNQADHLGLGIDLTLPNLISTPVGNLGMRAFAEDLSLSSLLIGRDTATNLTHPQNALHDARWRDGYAYGASLLLDTHNNVSLELGVRRRDGEWVHRGHLNPGESSRTQTDVFTGLNLAF